MRVLCQTCKKKTYDSSAYTQCYSCSMEAQGKQLCPSCGKGYYDPTKFQKCYDCGKDNGATNIARRPAAAPRPPTAAQQREAAASALINASPDTLTQSLKSDVKVEDLPF